MKEEFILIFDEPHDYLHLITKLNEKGIQTKVLDPTQENHLILNGEPINTLIYNPFWTMCNPQENYRFAKTSLQEILNKTYEHKSTRIIISSLNEKVLKERGFQRGKDYSFHYKKPLNQCLGLILNNIISTT